MCYLREGGEALCWRQALCYFPADQLGAFLFARRLAVGFWHIISLSASGCSPVKWGSCLFCLPWKPNMMVKTSTSLVHFSPDLLLAGLHLGLRWELRSEVDRAAPPVGKGETTTSILPACQGYRRHLFLMCPTQRKPAGWWERLGQTHSSALLHLQPAGVSLSPSLSRCPAVGAAAGSEGSRLCRGMQNKSLPDGAGATICSLWVACSSSSFSSFSFSSSFSSSSLPLLRASLHTGPGLAPFPGKPLETPLFSTLPEPGCQVLSLRGWRWSGLEPSRVYIRRLWDSASTLAMGGGSASWATPSPGQCSS